MRRNWTGGVAVAAGALAISGCSNPLGRANGPEIGVALSVPSNVALPSSAMHVRVSGQDVRLDAPPAGNHASAEVRGIRYGEEPVVVTLMAGDDTLAHGVFSLELRRDHDHWITGLVGRQRPVGFCIGALAPLPLRGSVTDTMFVTYGSIPKGAIC